MSMQVKEEGGGRFGPLHTLITVWALAGGALIALVVAVNVLSVAGSALWRPFPGDFEITEMGVAVAASMFLPYCQLNHCNVTADIFTAGLPPRWVAALSALASLVALGFSLLLLTRMYAGMLDQKAYSYTTAILQLPHWMAYAVFLVSLFLLAIAAVMTFVGNVRDAKA